MLEREMLKGKKQKKILKKKEARKKEVREGVKVRMTNERRMPQEKVTVFDKLANVNTSNDIRYFVLNFSLKNRV